MTIKFETAYFGITVLPSSVGFKIGSFLENKHLKYYFQAEEVFSAVI